MSGPLAGMRIGLLTASASRLGGGVFEAVVNQAALIRAQGGEAPVFALADAHSADDRARFGPDRVTVCAVTGPPQIGFAPALVGELMAARLDCLHLHGIWMYPSRAAAVWGRRSGKPVIISPHGMLDPWITARGRWKKALARAGYEQGGWRAAHLFHALTAAEAADIARETGRGDSAIIPNPAPPAEPVPPAELRPPIVAYIGRIHPKKNLLALVAGWRAANLPAGARLRIAGWGDPADVAALEAAVTAAGPGVEFLGAVYGAAKAALIGGARFTVLPSLSEGLPMAVLEGWAAGTPAIMSADCNLPEGFAAGAARQCGHGEASIAATLQATFAAPADEWLAMAKAAHQLATGPFAAEQVAARWAAVYGKAMGKPADVSA